MTKVETILAQIDGLLNAAYEVVYGHKDWNEVTPLVAIAAEMICEERRENDCAYWVIFKGDEKDTLEAKNTLESIGLCVCDYYWRDTDESDTAGGHMSVYWH